MKIKYIKIKYMKIKIYENKNITTTADTITTI